MPDSQRPIEQILRTLQERAKELNCLYRVEEILHSSPSTPLESMLREVVHALPSGLQYPTHCVARVVFRDLDVFPEAFHETEWRLSAPIEVQEEVVGSVQVYYTHHLPEADEGPFLKEERRLIETIASRIGQAVMHRDLAEVLDEMGAGPEPRQDWRIIVDLLQRTDQRLYHRIARKLLNHLSRSGVEYARDLLASLVGRMDGEPAEAEDENRPSPRHTPRNIERLASETFLLAADSLGGGELLHLLQMWLQEDRVHFLLLALESSSTTLAEVGNAVERYEHTGVNARDLSPATHTGLKVSLARRLLTEQLDFIEVCRRSVEIEDFFSLMAHTIQLPNSRGKLGGKSAGLFLAQQILRRAGQDGGTLGNVKVPRTWYLPSDGLLHFIAHNNLDDVYHWKYLDIDQVRQEYPNLQQVFKNSRFPTEFMHGVSTALDDFGDKPLIVRSSSLLEDRAGSAFSGKYKSLFLANQGKKPERLGALLDAIAEVYSSVFGPDPIQYRSERGLLDHHEEMGIMIQEVVGTRIGRYFMPTWAGVGFSHNELRWSPRIRREDGLLRLVPGLGTRAVDRLSDDYPVLAAPGQPGLRVNVSPEDVARYSPRYVDVIDLGTNSFETLRCREFLREAGHALPGLANLVSLYERDMIRRPGALDLDFDRDQVVFTFDGLLDDPAFIERMRGLLGVLRDALGAPVDIEFACDGTDFYLLQCRQQSHSPDATSAPIPRDIPSHLLLFSANRYVTNGSVPDITHIVYVDPEAYLQIEDLSAMRDVGHAIGRLNKILPKRQFILMGPGRWGSRGDIRLGVSVTYADINNTAALIEIARKRANYVPDLSFGTHFFQDLVESSIRYLPLYPDDPGVVFQETFFRRTENVLPRLLPEYAGLAGILKVIDVPNAAEGRVLRLLMNADLDEAVGVLASPGSGEALAPPPSRPGTRPSEDHSRWRMTMAMRLAVELDASRFGVLALYVFGSAKNATAGPASDLDLLIHVAGTEEQKRDLELWLEGWSLCLAEINYLRTGYRTEGLIDAHFVTDDDIARKTSYAAKIGAVTDAARPLPIGPRKG